MPHDQIAATLDLLERRLLAPETRRDPVALTSLLAEGFVEFGSSGRIFTREEIIAELGSESAAGPKLSLRDFAITPLAPDVVLATYRSQRSGLPNTGADSLRSSVWLRRGDEWKIVFHQGTRIP